MEQFVDKIKLVRSTDLGVPRILDIDLAIVAIDLEYKIAGNVFYILASPTGSEYIDVRFNKLNQAAVPLYQQMGLETPFHTLYITTPAGQTGTMKILYATEAPEFLRVIDNRSATSADLDQIRQELQGDTTPENWDTEKTVGVAAVLALAANAGRKGAVLQAKAINTGKIYIGFDNTVTSSKWIAELQNGMSICFDDYRGDLYAIADAAGQLLGWGEW